MDICSWNINGIASASKKSLTKFILDTAYDTYCFQEVRAPQDTIEEFMQKNIKQQYFYKYFIADKKGYSGVLTVSKIKPTQVLYGIGNTDYDSEARVLTLKFATYYLINVYVPHPKRMPFKLDFMQHLDNFINNLKKVKPVIVVGDFNACHTELDLAMPKQNKHSLKFTPAERAAFDNLLKLGLLDSYRYLNTTRQQYTFWANSKDSIVRKKNIGWRIDYILVDIKLKKKLQAATILDNVYGSDHCPIHACINV